MEIDQSVLESLPFVQRQKICKQIRQQQVQRYNDWIKTTPQGKGQANSPKSKRRNKKGTEVAFGSNARLVDATARFDDREGMCCWCV